jgi:hypothetical protein
VASQAVVRSRRHAAEGIDRARARLRWLADRLKCADACLSIGALYVQRRKACPESAAADRSARTIGGIDRSIDSAVLSRIECLQAVARAVPYGSEVSRPRRPRCGRDQSYRSCSAKRKLALCCRALGSAELQMWVVRAQSRCRGGSGEPVPCYADCTAAGVSPQQRHWAALGRGTARSPDGWSSRAALLNERVNDEIAEPSPLRPRRPTWGPVPRSALYSVSWTRRQLSRWRTSLRHPLTGRQI